MYGQRLVFQPRVESTNDHLCLPSLHDRISSRHEQAKGMVAFGDRRCQIRTIFTTHPPPVSSHDLDLSLPQIFHKPRGIGEISQKSASRQSLSGAMLPWLTKLGSSSHNLTQAATVRKSCTLLYPLCYGSVMLCHVNLVMFIRKVFVCEGYKSAP